MVILMKALKIAQIIIWSVIAAVLLWFLVYMIATHGNIATYGKYGFTHIHFKGTQTTLINSEFSADGINGISTGVSNADVTVSASDTDKIKVVCYGNSDAKNDVGASVKDGVLKISQNSNFGGFFLFNFQREPRFEIYIPKTYNKELNVSDVSGDVSIKDNFAFSSAYIYQTSGDLNAKDIKTGTFKANNTSGDINITSVDAPDYSLSSISGDLSIQKLNGSGALKSTSGDVTAELTGMTGGVDASSVSGDINISCDTGAEVSAKSVSGTISTPGMQVDGSFVKNSVHGKIGREPYKSLSLRTISGDVNIISK